MNVGKNTVGSNYRFRLLTTASICVLACATAVKAGEVQRPPVWLELGWQFERVGGGEEAFAPPFLAAIDAAGFSSPLPFEKPLPWSYGADAAVTFQPEGSDWFLAASIRYGRAHGRKSIHEQTKPSPIHIHFGTLISAVTTPVIYRYEEVKTSAKEAHTILDFQAGRDVGLGLFGSGSTSQIAGGVRIAQFRKNSHISIYANPSHYIPTNLKYYAHYTRNSGKDNERRSFHGIGPMLSWSASAPIAGNDQDGELNLDWGINAAVLFGKQRTVGSDTIASDYYKVRIIPARFRHTHYQTTQPHDRSRSVTVPNLGGFAGISLKWTNAKVSLGYRADVFFNAIDGGIDTRKSENRGFFGPYASISVGLGD